MDRVRVTGMSRTVGATLLDTLSPPMGHHMVDTDDGWTLTTGL